jgi:nitroimidazol reductase NimA-like FMN-containing flavoprotein (pyridoxamine 5'-phosphate oxidase superfamily)
MKFNKITRGHNREENTTEDLYQVLDAGYLCTIAISHNGIPMMIPTAYGRKDDVLYFHGSNKNFILNEALKAEKICVQVTHTDGIVLAKTLFNTSLNFRSAIVFGKPELITDKEEHLEALKIITENIIPNRWQEVELGDLKQINATLVIKMKIESASVKIRNEGPAGDEKDSSTTWSGHIPIKEVALAPIFDEKRDDIKEISESVAQYCKKYSL